MLIIDSRTSKVSVMWDRLSLLISEKNWYMFLGKLIEFGDKVLFLFGYIRISLKFMHNILGILL